MKKQSQKRIRGYSFLVVLLVFFGLFSRVFALTVLKNWTVIGGTITLNDDYSIINTSTVTPDEFIYINGVGELAGGVSFSSSSLPAILFANGGGAGIYSGSICFGNSSADCVLSSTTFTNGYNFSSFPVNSLGEYGGFSAPPINTSYINSGLPSPNTNTLSTTVSFSADYFYSTTGYPLIYIPTEIEPSFNRLDVPEATQFGTPCPITVTDTIETCTGSISLTSGGRYSVEWFMIDGSSNVALTSTPYQFGVVSATGLPDLIPSTPSITYESCSTGDFACYMRNALTWAFTVPQSSFDQFYTLRDTLKLKAPFGYVTSLFSVLGTFNDTGTSTFTLESFTALNDLIFIPIRTGLTWLLVLVFAFGMYERFKNVNL